MLLGTAIASVITATGDPQLVRILIDPGSQASFITEACFNRLRLKRRRRFIQIAGIGAVPGTTNGVASVSMCPRNGPHLKPVTVDVHILQHISTELPAEPVSLSIAEQTYYHPLADPQFSHPGQIDVLLGADSLHLFMPNPGPPDTVTSRFYNIGLGYFRTSKSSIRAFRSPCGKCSGATLDGDRAQSPSP